MTQKSTETALLPPMRLAADDLEPDAAAELRDTRVRLSQEFQAQLDERRTDGLAPLARQIAEAELSLGMLDEGLSNYRRAAQLLGKGDEAVVLAATHYAIAEIERGKGRPGEAQNSYLEAAKAFARSEDPGAQATCWLCAGEMRAQTNRIGDALEAYQNALELFRARNDDRGQALALFRSAQAMAGIDRSAARAQYAEAREIFERVDNATTIDKDGRVANEPLPDPSADLRAAEPWLLAKLCAAQASAVDVVPSTPLGSRSGSRRSADRLPMLGACAVAVLVVGGALLFRPGPEPMPIDPAAKVVEAAAPPVSTAIARAAALGRSATEHLAGGDREAARAAYEQALDIYRRAGDSSGQGNMLVALAAIEKDAGNTARARELYEESHAGFRDARDLRNQAAAALAVTAIDEATDNTEQLEQSYVRQAELCGAIDDRDGQRHALERLVALHLEHGKLPEAHALLVRLLPIHESGNDKLATARTLEQLGALEMSTGIGKSTRAKLERAYTLYRESNHLHGQARSLIALGDLDMANAQPWQARATYRQVVALLADRPLQETHRRALVKLATVEGSLGQTKRATELFQQALQSCTPADGDECQGEIRGQMDALSPRDQS